MKDRGNSLSESDAFVIFVWREIVMRGFLGIEKGHFSSRMIYSVNLPIAHWAFESISINTILINANHL